MSEITQAEIIEIAEWCGWVWLRCQIRGVWHARLEPPGSTPVLAGFHVASKAEPTDVLNLCFGPKCGESLDACREFERLAEERGLWREYGDALVVDVVPKERLRTMPHFGWIGATATPEQRCRAILAVIREKKTK